MRRGRACLSVDSMRMLKIEDSSNVQAVGYEPAARHLVVSFRGGSSYRYDEVPPDVFACLVSAKSVGEYLNQRIKGRDTYPHQRLDAAPVEPLAEGQRATLTIRVDAVVRFKAVGCYRLELDRKNFDHDRLVWIDADEIVGVA